MGINFTILLEILGTFAFAVSGIKSASGRKIDWFGAYIMGLVTAIGGGTIRDVLLGVTTFWMVDFTCFLITGVALATAIIFKEKLFKWGSALFLFDTIGLGLFTIVGITKSISAGLPFWVCIIMGTITGSVGGLIRDVLLNEVPLLFRRDLYALACIAGGSVYFICNYINFPKGATETIAAFTIIGFRLIAVKFHLHLPQLQSLDNSMKEGEE